jgi:hypothetical protein
MAEPYKTKDESVEIDRLHTKAEKLRASITALELQLALLQQRTLTVENRLGGFLSSIVWASRAIVGTILAAAVMFIINGGISQ